MIYEPAEDSVLILKRVKECCAGKMVLDLGTGSGILAEEAQKCAKEVLAADINEEAVLQVRRKGIKAVVSDLFSNVKGEFEVILFNPPYLPEEPLEDEGTRQLTTGGKLGTEIIERFLKDVKKHLASGGKILMVTSSLTGDVEFLFRKYRFQYQRIDQKNLFFEELFLYALWKEK
ncbi:MAG TPA: HemK2/MTQ2 family protein methyltransferase [Candidatus Nanoarchaeia archaeon]|nr:HemK2/MTQ2 family protein methyltransferase [Candidatus Nanoarchaeia archaeon]